MPPSTRLARSIGTELRLRPRLLLRNAASRSSKAFPICNRLAARVKALKQDTKRGVLQNSPAIDDRHWLPENIRGTNSSDPEPRHRYRPILAAEIANRRGAISEDRCADRKARDFSPAPKSRVCTLKTSGDHPAQVSSSTSPFR